MPKISPFIASRYVFTAASRNSNIFWYSVHEFTWLYFVRLPAAGLIIKEKAIRQNHIVSLRKHWVCSIFVCQPRPWRDLPCNVVEQDPSRATLVHPENCRNLLYNSCIWTNPLPLYEWPLKRKSSTELLATNPWKQSWPHDSKLYFNLDFNSYFTWKTLITEKSARSLVKADKW